MEGINNLIKDEHLRGRLKGIKITNGCTLTHLLFVDDIMVFINGSIGDISSIKATFSLFQVVRDGLKYLGYKLKPLGYKIAYWTWLISKLEKVLNTWYLKYLSRAGRLTLIKSVLEATLVYWISLAWIPRGILNRVQALYCRFLWQGNKQGRIFAWVRWEALNLPKKWGGLGIKKLEDFSLAL
eukprot:PITA_35540